MRRQTLGSTSHAARRGSMSRATIRKVDHSTVIPTADMDAGSNDSPKGVPIVQPYGFSYWPKSQEEDKGGQQQGSSEGVGGNTSGSGPGGEAGTGEREQQPKGKSAIGLASYANGNRSDPSSQNLQDPRHHLMLGDPKQDQNQQVVSAGGGAGGSSGGGGQKEYGGKEGDVALYRTSDSDNIQQFHLTEEGPRLSSVKKWKMQLIPEEGGQSGQGGQSGGSSGGSSGGQGGQQGEKKDGQNVAFKRETNNYLEFDPETKKATMRFGDGHVTASDKAMTMHYKDETISHRVTDQHVHMRFKDFKIWIDETGCHSSHPITIVDDSQDSGS